MLASDIKYMGLTLRNDQVSYKTILEGDGVQSAAGFLRERRTIQAKMINKICERLESVLQGKSIPEKPRLWDMTFEAEGDHRQGDQGGEPANS